MDARNNQADEARSIVTSRIYDAPRELVWRAFTEIEHLTQWWGPNGFTTTTSSHDFRPGGMWRFVMHGPDGRDWQNRIVYDEIVKPERIAYHHGGEGDTASIQFITTVTFEDLNGKTKLTLRALFPTAAERDAAIKERGAAEGGKQTLGRLADHLATLSNKEKTKAPGNETTSLPFIISRLFDAPRELVFDAFTQLEHLTKWFGPKGFKMVSTKLDLKPGGVFLYGMQGPDGNTMWGKWIFREIKRPDRLAVVVSFSDEKGGVTRHPLASNWPLETLSTTTFTDQNGKTLITLNWEAYNATEEEKKIFAGAHAGMNAGWSGTMDQLDHYLASLGRA